MEVLLSCIITKAIFLPVLLLPCGTSAQRYLSHTKGIGELQDSFSKSCVDRRGAYESALPFTEMRGGCWSETVVCCHHQLILARWS